MHLTCNSTSYRGFIMPLSTCLLPILEPILDASACTLNTNATVVGYPVLPYNHGIPTIIVQACRLSGSYELGLLQASWHLSWPAWRLSLLQISEELELLLRADAPPVPGGCNRRCMLEWPPLPGTSATPAP